MDRSFEEFEILRGDLEGRWSQIITEEDAKIQSIQSILTHVLGWRLSDIRAERQHNSGFSDYLILQDESPAFVVEAKRLGMLNIGTTERERHKAFKISGPALRDCVPAIEQARTYASDEGLRFYVVSDGSAWIVGKTNVDGRRWRDVEAFVFPSLAAISDGFPRFYELLSAGHVRKRTYIRLFDEIHQNRSSIDLSLFSPLSVSDISIERKSPLAFDLERVFDVYFGKMQGDEDPDLLVSCFVETRESRVADFSLEKMTAKILGNINPDFYNIDGHLTFLVASAIEVEDGQTVFIIGPTGAGKTTFIDRFFRKTLPDQIRAECCPVTVNMLDSVGDSLSAVPWLIERLIEGFEQRMFPGGYPKWEHFLGLYFGEYKRRSEGELATQYKTDPDQFKTDFGKVIEAKVRDDRDGYLRRLLRSLVVDRKKLPVFIIDNIDELPFDLQKLVFQAVQALRRHAKHALILIPITDKSAWSFSKSDIFGIYNSKSFFLPTPSPREVFRKRIEYLRAKADQTANDASISQYFLAKGIRVSISDLQAFSKVLEEVFVENEYASKTIGELANYNIRRMLSLSRRVMTSAVFAVDDIIKLVLTGGAFSPSASRFMNALLKGDYSYFRMGDQHEVYPIFQVSGRIPYSPLLSLRILSLMQSISNSGRGVDERHLSHDSAVSYFDALGVSEVAIDLVLSNLLEAKLLETFDSSTSDGELGRRYSISFAGSCHLRLARNNWIYFEQMALTTSIEDDEIAVRIKSVATSGGWTGERQKTIRSLFANYLLDTDKKYIGETPGSPQYLSQHDILTSIAQFAMQPAPRDVVSAPEDTKRELIRLEGRVDWFDPKKGFGFIEVPSRVDGVYIKDDILYKSGFKDLTPGDSVSFEAASTSKGLAVTRVLSVSSRREEVIRASASVIRVFWERGYGFARLIGVERDAFFHFSSLSTDLIEKLANDLEIVGDFHYDSIKDQYVLKAVVSVQ